MTNHENTTTTSADTSPDTTARLRAAKIVSVHGVRGMVKVQVFLQDPYDLTEFGPLTNRDGTKTYDLKIRGKAKGTLLCTVAGVRDREGADRMRGTELFLARDALPDVEDDEEFYVTDLVGMDVRDAESMDVIGRVRAVQDHGAGDIIIINYKQAGRRDDMFAFTYDIFPDVNMAERFLTFTAPDEVSERDADTGFDNNVKSAAPDDDGGDDGADDPAA